MDNFTGLFEDGELENLDLGGESFGTPQGPTPVSVPEMDLASYTQSYTDIGSTGNTGSNTAPSQIGSQGPPQKMTVGGLPQPNQSPLGNYSNQTQTYQYASATTSQQPAGQFAGGQYRSSFPGQEIYTQGPAVATNSGIPNWNTSDPFSQVPGSYQQQAPSSFPQAGINSYPNQNISSGPVNNIQSTMTQSYQGLPPQNNMSQGYTTGSQGIPYQGAPRPSYPNYDPQSPIGSASNVTNFNSGGQPATPGQSQQQYPLMQNPRQPYHIGQYAQQQSQVPMAPQQQPQQQPPPPPQQQQASQQQQQQVPGQQIICGPRPQGDISQYSNSPVPNGTPYRAPFPQLSPQLSPHPQASPRPQLSPMPRSMSPHARPNSGLAMTSPVSSPAALPSSSSSPNPNSGAGSAANLQQLENLVKPSGAGRNTPTNPPCTTPTQQPLHSPGIYGNSGVHSPMGQRAPMSPGLLNRPPVSNPMSPGLGRPPLSPQQWQQTRPISHQNYIQANFNQGVITVQRPQAPSSLPQHANTIPHGQISNDSSLSTDSIASVSDSSLNINGSAIGVSNGPVTSNIVIENITVSLESGHINDNVLNSVDSEASCGPGITNVVSIVNGTMPLSESIPGQCNMSPNVPPSNISPGGAPSSLVSSSGSPQLTPSGNVPPNSLAQGIGPLSAGATIENGLSSNSVPITGPIKVMHHIGSPISSLSGSPMPSVAGSPGNTMVRISGPPQGPRLSYPQQGYLLIGPRVCGPPQQGQSNQMAPGSPHQANSSTVVTSSTIMKSNKLSNLNRGHLVGQNSPTTISVSQTPIPQESPGSQSLLSEEIGEHHNLHEIRPPETIQLSANATVPPQQPILHTISQPVVVSNDPGILTQNAGGKITNGPLGPTGCVQMAASLPSETSLPSQGTGSQPLQNSNQLQTQVLHTTTVTLHPVNNQSSVVAPNQIVTGNQVVAPVQSSAGSTIPSGAPMVAGRTQAAPLQPIVRPVQPAGTQAQPPPIQPQLNLSIEIQQCQQQLQQMFKMPQSVQTQQKINELQQRLTHLQQQQQKQQQHFLQNQAYYSSQTPASSDSPEKKAVKKKISKPRTPKEPKPPKTPKPKKEAKPKEPKAKKEPKIKTPKEPKPPKEQKPKKEKVPKPPKQPKPQKPPKEKKTPAPKRSRKKPTVNTPVVPAVDTDGQILPVDSGTGAPPAALMDPTLTPGTPVDSAKTAANATPKPKSEKKTKVKNSFSSKKKSNSKMNLNSKSKRKRRPSESDFSESEGITLPKAEGNDDDESKRRSGRNQGSRKKYVDELELNLSEEDELKNQEPLPEDDIDGNGVKLNYVVVDPNGEDAWAVQMIMSVRIGEREIFSDSEELDGENKKVKIRGKSKKIEVEEFFVKYKTFSYLHCEWKTEEELLKGDKRIQGKIKRFKQKRAASQNIMDFLEEEPFNPDYVEIDRILDCLEYNDPESGKVMRHYLVKWKALPYEDVTWELEEDCDVEKIELFQQYRNPPPKAELRIKKRPKPEEWKKLEASPIYKNNNQLREYQLEGLNWLNFSYYNGHNCILADEMGLGKTIQSLAFVHSIFSYGIRGPYLIIAPLSTIPNWQREFEGWTDLNVIVYHGSQASRNMILEYEMYYKDAEGEKIPNVYKFHVLITTFEVIISDSVELKEINWRCCIIDEAHRLKNRNCKLLEGLRIMHMEHRVLLSGTPLQNNVNELFSLLNFLEPSQFSCQETFLQEFGKLETEEQVKKLQALLKPMMLRRMKEDVEKSLAPKEETIIEVELTNIQKKYYRAILERNFDFLIKGATYTNVPSLMNTVMELRKCCLHPYLLNGAEDGIQQDYKDYHPQACDIYHNALIQSSGKMVLVDKLLPRLKANGHRVLIFSQMVKLLDIIEDYLIYRKYPYERLDGRIRGNLRQAAIDRFCKPDSDRFVFLLCTKAGGLGINLTAADTVIIYDSDWNPQNDLQAQARCHRIGQQKCVKIYRLLCRNTYEREMFDKASLKLGLDKAVLQSMNTEVKAAAGNSLGLSKKDIEDLLKKGAYGALMEEDNQGDKFCEEDIDQIMSRRTTVITLESEKGSTFSKASFSASSNRSDIDLDDPDFWKKWAKRADIDLEAGEKQLIMEEPRRRSQIRRYGHDESVMDCSDLETSASDSGGEQEQTEDAGGETRSRTRRGRGRGKTRGQRNSRNTRSSRWNTEEEPGDMDEVKYGQWHRSECFKVEKGLLTYGWGRWEEIMKLGEFRSAWKVADIQECARMILLFCIRYYRGDDKIKGFIFDLIAPTSDGKTRMHHNHIGLSAPVPRGRKGKKKLREAKLIASHMEGADWAKEEKFDTDTYLDQGYSRHLTRHANKVLLRVRLLFYIKQEIIGDLSSQIEDNCRANDLPIHPPPTELPPKPWWDSEADRNILVGVYKHGYDRYNVVRNDPYLCFLARCGPPDKAALVAEMSNNVNEDEMEKDDKEEKEEEKDDSDSNQTIPASPAVSSATNKSEEDATKEREKRESKLLPFPSSSDINGRLRRLVTSYQRNNKKMEMRKEANVRGFDHYLADKLMRRERMAEYIRERELRKADYNQRRWSNREQAEFYRTISTFGVEYIRKEKRYDWNKFRMLSRLEKRLDENLTEYFRAFMAMCKRQCGIRLSDQENAKIVEVGVDRLPEERARRVLERVDLLNRLRNDILPHPDIQKALAMALPSKDLPDWWIPGKHDLDLVRGVARHGLGRTDYYILYDPDLCFREILRRHTAGEPLITKDEKEELNKKFYKGGKEEEEEDGEEEREDEDGKEDISSKEKTDNAEELKSELSEDDKESATEAVKDEETALQKAEDLCTKESSDEKELENRTEDDPEEKGEDGEKPNSEQETDPKEEDETENNESVQQEPEHTMLKEEKDDDKASHENIDKKELNENDALEKEERKDEKNEVQQVDKELKEELKDTKDAIPAPPLLSLQQMDEAMSKMGSGLTIDSLAANEPTVAQLLAQSAANPIKWPKDRVLQTRLEHMMYAVEHKKWPVPIDFQSSDHDLLSSSKCDTPPSAPSTPTGHHPTQELLMMEVEKRKRRHMEEVERAHLQAMLHPNLHHNMALSKVPHTTAAAAAAAAAALGFNPNSFSVSNLRSFMEANDPDKKTQSMVADSHAHALRQLQALQGSLDLTIKPVSSQSLEMGMAGYLNRRGPGRPRLDEPMLKNLCHNTEKRRACESPHDKSQDKKRRKLDDIVLGLSSSKGKSPDGMDAVVKEANNPLALLKGSSVTLLTSKDKAQVTPAVTTPKLSSSISITPTSIGKFPNESKGDCHSPGKGFNPLDKEGGGNKPGLVKSSDLPPGISLPPGIELYRPTDSAKVDKWLEQHQDHLLSDTKRDTKRRKIDFTSLDWTQFSGDEHVPVVNTSTGQKLNSSECPKLKHLAQWLMEHPNYDVDPHWSEAKKESSASNSAPSISDLQRRLLSGDKKSGSNRGGHSISSPMASPSVANTSPTTSAASSSGVSSKNMLDPRHLLQGLDLKNPMTLAALTSLDPKLLANLDPKILFGGIDPKLLGIDPKQAFDPKILAAMGIDPKLFGMDLSKHQEQKPDKKPSPAPSPSSKSSDPKPSTSHGIDPKTLGLDPKLLAGLDPKLLGFDPKLLAGLDPKALAGIDPKSLGLDPKLLGVLDPKLLSSLGAAMDPKFFAGMGGMDPVMMMAGFGGLPGMAGLGLANPLLAGLPAFNLPGMPNIGGSSSKSKDNQRNAAAAAAAAVAASQANLFSGMFGSAGAAGLMYPPLGLGGLGNFQLSQMSVAQSSGLLNGFSPTITATAGSSKVQTSSAGAAARRQQQRQDAERERDRKERLKDGMKAGGLSKEERHLLKQMKAERLARVDPRTTVQSHEALLASHLSQLSALGQIDLSVRPISSSGSGTNSGNSSNNTQNSAGHSGGNSSSSSTSGGGGGGGGGTVLSSESSESQTQRPDKSEKKSDENKDYDDSEEKDKKVESKS